MLKSSCWSNALYLGERKGRQLSIDLDLEYDELNKWMNRYEGKEEVLKVRLIEENLTVKEFTQIITNEGNDYLHKEMDWFIFFRDTFGTEEQEIEDTINLNSDDIPFFEFMLPFLEKAKKMIIQSSIVSNNHILQTSAYNSILQIIAKSITEVSLKTLIFELNKSRLNKELKGDTPEERYNHFVFIKFGDKNKILNFLSEYPSLARILSELVKNVTKNFILMLEKLIIDKKEIESVFNFKIEQVLEIQSMGDFHKKGQTVLKIEFNNGQSLIYKPRSLSIDVHLQKLLEWFNDKGLSKRIRTFNILDKGDYGWAEFITYKECENKEDIEDFYIRQGHYLAIFYMLNGTDFHYENIIASGSDPIFVDIESIFHTYVNSPNIYKTSSYNHAIDIIAESVIRTSLLPVIADNSIFDFDVSGLGGGGSDKVYRYQIINNKTDEMKMVKEELSLPDGLNLPKFDNKIYGPENYISNIEDGFSIAYKIILSNREELLSKKGPLSIFKNDTVRVILRNTAVYSLLLEASYHPKYLKSGLERSRLFELLWRIIVPLPERTKSVYSEIEEMLLGDIPYFYCYINSKTIYGHEKMELNDLCKKDSYTFVVEKIKKLSYEDLRRQLIFIKNSLSTKYALTIFDTKKKILDPPNKFEPENINMDIFLKEAIKIGEQISKEAIWGEDGSVTWIGLGMGYGEKLEYTVTDFGIYNGVLGIAYFYGYLAHETNNEKFKKIAHACIQTALKEDSIPDKQIISAYSGYGSLIYVLQHFSKLWNDKSLLDIANNYLTKIDRAIDNDKNFDFLNGAAGTLIVTLNFYLETGSNKALNIARKCGDHLIKNAIKMSVGYGWTPSNKKDGIFLSGLSHGNAGISLALLYLYKVLKDKNYFEMAKEALKYENSLYDSKENNWLDLRDNSGNDSTKSVTHWCSGAPGIGLGRLRMLDFYKSDILKNDLKLAIDQTLLEGITGLNFSLCHGDLGNLELLLLASSRTKNKDLYEKTMELAYKIMYTTNKNEYDWKCGVPGGQQTPNFMVGLAGIGYQLLRIYNNNLPSILILEK